MNQARPVTVTLANGAGTTEAIDLRHKFVVGISADTSIANLKFTHSSTKGGTYVDGPAALTSLAIGTQMTILDWQDSAPLRWVKLVDAATSGARNITLHVVDR